MELRKGYKVTDAGVIPYDWDVKPLKLLTNLIIDGTHVTPEYCDTGAPFLRVTDIQKPEIDLSEVKYISLDSHRYLSQRCKPVKGDLLLSKNGTVGIPKLVTWDWEFSIFVSLALLKLKKQILDGHFLEQFFKSNYLSQQVQKRSKQGTVINLHLGEIRELLIPIPPTIEEQRAIAAALSDVDALIASLDALIAKKRLIKQGAMQELLTGKRRLPGFSGEWNEKKFGEIGNRFLNGGTPSTKNADYWQGSIPWITGADIIGQRVQEPRRFITEDAVRNSATNIVEKGQLLVVTRTGVGKVAIAPYNLAISQDLTGVYLDSKKFSSEFLFRYFDYNSDMLRKLNQGTSIEGITRETLQGLKIYMPNIDEQRAIAGIISDMDSEILALEQQRDKTRLIKQGMMQELLTGRTRIV